jgi:tyrosinase
VADQIRIRQAVHNLTAQDLAEVRDAYRQQQAIFDNRGYQFLAGLHGVPSWYCWHHQQNAHSALSLDLFLPWHRAYLYQFEMGLRDRAPGVTLPWWDWTLGPPRQKGLPQAFIMAKGADGSPNPLLGFRINQPTTNPPLKHMTKRKPGPWNALPTDAQVQALIGLGDWTDFTTQLENVHDQVHTWVSGDMGLLSTAAYDPIFWSHHAMIDRIWALWQVRNGNSNIAPDLFDVVLDPFNLKVRDVLNVNTLGYDYAAGAAAVSLGGSG